MRRLLRRPSPLRRVAGPFHLWLIGPTYRTFGRRRVSPVMLQDHFLQAAARITLMGHFRRSALPFVGRTIKAESAVSRSHLAWPLRHAVFSGPPGDDALAAYLRRKRTECEQGVLYGCGPAQVGFSVRLSSFHRFSLSSRGILSPEHCGSRAPEGRYKRVASPSGDSVSPLRGWRRLP
jgi:hypothetical protein